MKKKSRASVILFGICALVWSGKAVFEAFFTSEPVNTVMLILDAACAVCWICAFFSSLKRYRSKQDENK